MFVAPKDILSEVWHGFRWGIEGAEREFKADVAHSINDFKNLLPVYISDTEEIGFSKNLNSYIEAKIKLNPHEYLWQHRRFKSTLGKNKIYK